MKRKIAVLANGWNNISISQALKGIQSETDKLNIDIFLFLSYAAFSQTAARNKGEDAIFDLPDYTDFDGVILFSNMLNSESTPERLAKKLAEKHVNTVSVGIPLEGVDYVGIDNFSGMYDMVEHLVKKHHIKNPAFFAGTREHVDSNERLVATREALAKYGIELKPENVCYTNWEYITSMNYAMEFCKRKEPPDAFICANDHNALAVCVGLSRMGYSVPDDFIVTGFDRISFADTFFPSITTVYQNYEKIGYLAARHLIQKMEGVSTSDHLIVPTTFIKNESCGCRKTSTADKVRQQFCIEAYTKEMESLMFKSNEADMTTEIFACASFETFKENLYKFYSSNRSLRGDEFYFVIDNGAKRNIIQSSLPVMDEYSDTMNCLVAVKESVISVPGEFPRSELIPGYEKSVQPAVFTFTSMHFDEHLFGYIVTCDSIESIRDRTLNLYMMQMNYNIEQYRKNCRLEEMNRTLLAISNTDELTGLNNRFGMNQRAVPLMENAHKDKIQCAVVFIDINRMKYINDNFGHVQGDLAIRTVASVLQDKMPDGWIGIRYGGDEFIAVGACEKEKLVKEFIENYDKELKTRVNSMNLTYPLTVSIGYILSDPESSLSLSEYVNKADSIMYESKQKTYNNHHQKK